MYKLQQQEETYTTQNETEQRKKSTAEQKQSMLDFSGDEADFGIGIEKQNNLNKNLEFDFNDTLTVSVLMGLYDLCFQQTETQKLLTCRYSLDSKMAAVGSEEGLIRVLKDDKVTYYLLDKDEPGKPVTCLRWRPQNPQNLDNTLLAVYANGKAIYWHVTSSKALTTIHEKDNFLNACDFSVDSLRFATGGSDGNIRVYDAGRNNPSANILKGTDKIPKHSNRVFALQFNSGDPNLLYSAGWDNLVMKWDTRVGAIGYIHGPSICGDALHQQDQQILTGSWRQNDQIQVWDERNLKCLYTVPWQNIVDQKSMVYSCQFDKTGKYILAGSSGTSSSEIRIFDRKFNGQCLETFNDFKGGAFSLDSTKKQQMLVATAQGKLLQIDYSSV